VQIEPTDIPGLHLIRLQRTQDERGSFARLFDHDVFAAAGLATTFLQESLSVTRRAGTLRGMHFQRSPHAEVKFVCCVRGAIHDVVVDLRPESPGYLQWRAYVLSPESDLALHIPEGCAHGFLTLTDDCEVLYQMSAAYAPTHADGVRYDDPALGIAWPRDVAVIAEKDRAWPMIRQRLPREPIREESMRTHPGNVTPACVHGR
jgi:dTDP-4-dehydrorhamnose 3,5-epimerase